MSPGTDEVTIQMKSLHTHIIIYINWGLCADVEIYLSFMLISLYNLEN